MFAETTGFCLYNSSVNVFQIPLPTGFEPIYPPVVPLPYSATKSVSFQSGCLRAIPPRPAFGPISILTSVRFIPAFLIGVTWSVIIRCAHILPTSESGAVGTFHA
ncbi:MAG: hypothetical protein BWY22_01049 [Bacteroidetes bacterium ADurb.Bin217]|nr:MAG: hypothetical protein BWY22_01049 [Bacteroidetes bacterium ADurb.Bin217]